MRLDEKHRPRVFEDVAGQDKAVSVLSRVDCGGRGIYITGKSGTGKSTLALIVAERVAGCIEGITETTGRELTVNRLREWHSTIRGGRGLYGGYALIVNESHGLSQPTIEVFLDVLERLPDYTCVIFTTTKEGNDLFDDKFDSVPFASRCLRISLAQRDIMQPMAERCKSIAESEGLDGKPIEDYVKLLVKERCNMRTALNFIEAGGMLE